MIFIYALRAFEMSRTRRCTSENMSRGLQLVPLRLVPLNHVGSYNIFTES
jgi:hypothetical protein